MHFKLVSKYAPAGSQPEAIRQLTDGVMSGLRNQVLLGITGSGKTFTMANVINNINRPTLIIAHNKTLAAQIYSEMKEFFPENAVEYFVSYYDYYQPESYLPQTDTYIEKDSAINEHIDLLRHSATRSLIEREDVIVVSSVSCIYGLGSPDLYESMTLHIESGKSYSLNQITRRLIELQYERNDVNFIRGTFRSIGDNIDIWPSHYSEKAWRLGFFGNELEEIFEFDPLTGKKLVKLRQAVIYANSHYITPKSVIDSAIPLIQEELRERIEYFRSIDRLVEAQRIEQRTTYDIEMLATTGFCKGIENYTRYLSRRAPGQSPPTLFEYLPRNSLLFVDESHVMVPQIRAMYNGDRARKSILTQYGFRLESALDNRPLKFEEWQEYRPQTIFVSATPADFEVQESNCIIVAQVIRPTGLLDPVISIKPASTQVEDLIGEITAVTDKNGKVLVASLTKKMAESLSEYLKELGKKAEYLHSEVHTLDRIEIISNLRKGEIDILVGVNLLREGLDIPEVALVAILDADKEGFLRSETSLIQTIGRAARNLEGKVILYADNITKSMDKAVKETNRRRKMQIEYNKAHNIVPSAIYKNIFTNVHMKKEVVKVVKDEKKTKTHVEKLRKEMLKHAHNLEFEKATEIRDQINDLMKVIDLI